MDGMNKYELYNISSVLMSDSSRITSIQIIQYIRRSMKVRDLDLILYKFDLSRTRNDGRYRNDI